MDYRICPTPLSEIRAGDLVEIDGEPKTVCRRDLRDGFMGRTLWGDSYRLGTVPVPRVEWNVCSRCS